MLATSDIQTEFLESTSNTNQSYSLPSASVPAPGALNTNGLTMRTPSFSTVAASPIVSTTPAPSVTYNFVNNELVQSKTRAWTLVHDPVSSIPNLANDFANSTAGNETSAYSSPGLNSC